MMDMNTYRYTSWRRGLAAQASTRRASTNCNGFIGNLAGKVSGAVATVLLMLLMLTVGSNSASAYKLVTVKEWNFAELALNHGNLEAVTYSGSITVGSIGCDILQGDVEGLATQGSGSWTYRSAGQLQNRNSGSRVLGVLDLKADDEVTITTQASGYGALEMNFCSNGSFLDGSTETSATVKVTSDGLLGLKFAREAYLKSIVVTRKIYSCDIVYSTGDTGAMGTVPTGQANITAIVASGNSSLYKQGYTLTGWTDGTTTYNIGEEYSVTAEQEGTTVTLTPVFTENTVILGQLSNNVAVTFENVSWTTAGTANYIVKQASFNDENQDVPLIVNGKTFTVRASDGMTITLPEGVSASDFSGTGIIANGNVLKYTGDASEITVTYSGEETEIASIIITYPQMAKPILRQDIADTYAVSVGDTKALTVDVDNMVTEYNAVYQWYTNTSATTEGATAIAGANSASYTVPSGTVGTVNYYYCVATNDYGTVTSNIAKVVVKDFVTFDFKNWDTDDLVMKPAGDSHTRVTLWLLPTEAAPLVPYLEYPYSMVGYFGGQVVDTKSSITIVEGQGLASVTGGSEARATARGMAIFNLQSGDLVRFTGTGLAAWHFNTTHSETYPTTDNRATCEVEVNDAGTEAFVTMTEDGALCYILDQDQTSVIETVMIPNKYAPTITADLDGLSHTVGRGNTFNLSVTAKANDANELTYQWYRKESGLTNKDGVAIEGATSASYTTEPNTSYTYYCIVTNSGTGAVAASNFTRYECKPLVTYTYTDEAILGDAPAPVTVEIGGEFTIPSRNQTVYKPVFTQTGWTDGTKTYEFGQTYTTVNDLTLTPLYIPNPTEFSALHSDVNVTWELDDEAAENPAPAASWSDGNWHALVAQPLFDTTPEDLGIRIKDGEFDNTISGHDGYAFIKAGTTITMAARHGLNFTIYGEDGITPGATIFANDLDKGDPGTEPLTVDGNNLTYTYYGSESIVKLTFTENGYYQKIVATYPGATRPVFLTDLNEFYSTEVGTPVTLSVDVLGAKKLQWYKNTTASTEGGVAIAGATEASYIVDADRDAEEYYYVMATNGYGNTYSAVAKLRVFTYKTFDFQHWDDPDGKYPNLNTSVNYGKGATGVNVYALNYPYSMVGYFANQSGNTIIRDDLGLANSGSDSGNRSADVINLAKGDVISITGTRLDIAGISTDNCDVDLNEDNTEATVVMTANGHLKFTIPRGNNGIGNFAQFHTFKIPSKYAPVITKDVDENTVVEKNEEVTLSVEAELAAQIPGHSLSYQWYSNINNSNKGGTAIEGATEAEYTTVVDGSKTYFYCVVKNAAAGTAVASSPATVGYYKTITFENNDPAAYGAAPETQKIQSGKTMTIPVNQTLYKEGYTLTGWNDGVRDKDYLIGETYTANYDDNVVFHPTFVKNNDEISLANRLSAMSETWVFSTDNGSAKYFGTVSANVNQVEIRANTIDLGIKMTAGGDNVTDVSMNSNGWMKSDNVNYTIPVVKGTTITITVYNPDGITIGGTNIPYNTTYGKLGNVVYEYTYNGDDDELVVNVGNNYIKSIKADYPAPPSLTVTPTEIDLTISDDKVSYRTAAIELVAENLEAGETYAVTSSDDKVTISPATYTVAADGTVKQQFLVKYAPGTATEAAGTTVFTFTAGEGVEKTVSVSYGHTVAYSGTQPDEVTTKTVWSWDGATADIVPTRDGYMAFKDAGSNSWPAGVASQYLAGSGQYLANVAGHCFIGGTLYFNNKYDGTIEVEFSNTGTSDTRYLNINGVNTAYSSNSTTIVSAVKIPVAAGGVTIEGRLAGQNGDEYPAQYLRIYKVTYIPNAETPTITLDEDASTFTLSTTDFSLPDDDVNKETIYYTLDGSEPTKTAGTEYIGGAVQLSVNTTIKAIAISGNKNNSEIATVTTEFPTYELKVGIYPGNCGHVSYSPISEGNRYTKNAKVTVQALANDGYGFKGWTRTREQIGAIEIGEANYTFGDATYEITINTDNNEYWAVFAKGVRGTVTYDVTGAKFKDKSGNDVTASVEYTTLCGHTTFQRTISSTAISVPTNYGLMHSTYDYTLDYWVDANGKKYNLGDNVAFDEEKTGLNVTLYPVYRANNYNNYMETPITKYTVHWDFRTSYGAHQTELARGAAASTCYATHAVMTYRDADGNQFNKDTVDVSMKIVTDGQDASFTNKKIGTWATMTQGTKLVIPSRFGTKYILATYSPLNKVGGTTVNGVAPDNIDDEKITRTNDGAYLYTWTVMSSSTESELVIGNDYTYYQYLEAIIPNAVNQYINYSSNNNAMGTVTAEPAGEFTTIGTEKVYSYSRNEVVTLTAERKDFYELKYWLDGDGNKIYPNGYVVRAEQGDSVALASLDMKLGQITFTSVTNYTESEKKKCSISFILSNYLKLQAVFGDRKSYYINFSAGNAEGTALAQQHVEEGGIFVMPANNQKLYLSGYTLQYYADINDPNTHYEFGQNYVATKDLRLMPVFTQNTVSLADVSDEDGIEVEWLLTKDKGATDINITNANGVIVTQAAIGSQKIDVLCRVTARGSGKQVNNTKTDDACYISDSEFTIPTTKNCEITLEKKSGTISSNTIAGKGKGKYVESNPVEVTYEGDAGTQSIYFSEAGDYKTLKVKYKANAVSSAISSVKIGETDLTDEQVAALNSNKTIALTCDANYTDNSMPKVTVTAENNVKPDVTQPTVSNPTATVYVKNSGGLVLATYTINFSFNSGSLVAPTVKKVVVNDEKAEGNVVAKEFSSGNGVIAITFDHSVVAVDVAGLGQTLKGAVNDTTLTLTYWNLASGEHTLTIPENTISDIYGTKYPLPISVTFTVNSNNTVASGMYNFVVTHKVEWDAKNQTQGLRVQVVADDVIKRLDGQRIPYGTIDEATDMANKAKGSDRFYIFVPDGEYCMRGNEAGKFTEIPKHDGVYSYGKGENGENSKTLELHIADYNDGASYYNGRTFITRSNVSIIGQSIDKTILYNDPYLYGRDYCATFETKDSTYNTYFQDMTIENRYCDYQVAAGKNPTASVDKDNDTGAAAFCDRGIYTICKNVSMKGYEATYASTSHTGIASGGIYGNYPTGWHDSYRYYEDCSVWGTYCFVVGSGNAWWERPTIVIRKRDNTDNIALAMHPDEETIGFVFNDGVVKAEDGGAYNKQNGRFALGAPIRWAPCVTYLNMKFEITPKTDGWLGFQRDNRIRFHEFGSLTADSTGLDLAQRSIAGLTPMAGSDDCVLTSAQAAQYNLRAMYGEKNAYDPSIHTVQRDMTNIQPIMSDQGITWDGINNARCYVVFRKNKATDAFEFYAMTEQNYIMPDDADDGNTFCVRAANERGGLGKPSKEVVFDKLGEYTIEVKQVGPDEEKGWATVCLPENTTAPGIEDNDIVVYAAKTLDDGVLTMTQVDHLIAGQGYVIYAKPGTYTFKGTLTKESEIPECKSLLGGNPEDHDVSAGLLNIYVLDYKSTIDAEAPGFYKFVGSMIGAYKAYLTVETLESLGYKIDTNSAKLAVVFEGFEDDELEADAIDNVGDDNIIETDEEVIYDLTGKRIERSQMHKGLIYIINGKKVMY